MSALADYYRAQINELNDKAPLIQAQTEQTRAQTDQIAPDAMARRQDQKSAAELATEQAKSLALRTPSEVAQGDAQAALQRQQTADLSGGFAADITSKNLANQRAGLDLQPYSQAVLGGLRGILGNLTNNAPGLPAMPPVATPASLTTTGSSVLDPKYRANNFQTIGFAKGGIVGRDKMKPAAGDTVAAKLMPGEAVLNKHTVEHYGANVIDHMNAMGHMRKAAHGEVKKLIASMAGSKAKKKAGKKAA